MKNWRCWFKHKWTPPRGKCLRCGKWPKDWYQEIPVTVKDDKIHIPSFEVPIPKGKRAGHGINYPETLRPRGIPYSRSDDLDEYLEAEREGNG